MHAKLKYSDLDTQQINAVDFITEGEDSLLCADVGTGKTVISLTAINAITDVDRWLVVAPLLVATNTWANEARDWEHLQHIKVAVACGSEKQRLAAINDETAKAVVINYENLPWLMDTFPRPRKGKPETLPFDGLVCDEIDKLKSVSSNRFKKVRDRIGAFKRRIGLTGTLLPNDLTEVWGQVYMVDGGESFGRSFYRWRQEYFYPTDYEQRKWKALPGTEATILESMQGLALRLNGRGLPIVVNMPVDPLTMGDNTRATYRKLEKEYLINVKDADGKMREVDAESAGVLSGKLQQFCAGFSYVDGGKDAVWHTLARFRWLDDLVGRIVRTSHKQLLIFYHFNEEMDELKRRYPELAYIGKGVSNNRASDLIDQWNAGRLPMLALHPASAGHGLNLQKSGAHHIAFLTMPWSGGLYHQSVGRLARRGQTAGKIYIHTAAFEGTIDRQVIDAVTGKLDNMENFLGQLDERS